MDTTFLSQTWSSGLTGEIRSILRLDDGKFLVGVGKTNQQGKLWYINSNGELIQTILLNTVVAADTEDITETLSGSGRYLVGGNFSSVTINGVVHNANNIIGIERIEENCFTVIDTITGCTANNLPYT